jgi:hypothetical protein
MLSRSVLCSTTRLYKKGLMVQTKSLIPDQARSTDTHQPKGDTPNARQPESSPCSQQPEAAATQKSWSTWRSRQAASQAPKL